MEVLVSNRFIVTIFSTVFVTVIVMTDITLTVGDSVLSLACVGLMHVVVSCDATEHSGKCVHQSV